jgi:hypothetical protein
VKIRSHSESHIVELEDGSQWRIFPGDIDVMFGWAPETDFTLLKVEREIGSHVLVSETGPVRVLPVGECWPEWGSKIDPQGRLMAGPTKGSVRVDCPLDLLAARRSGYLGAKDRPCGL